MKNQRNHVEIDFSDSFPSEEQIGQTGQAWTPQLVTS